MDFFEQDEYWRRKERIAAAAEQNAAMQRQEAEQEALRKIKADQLTERANHSFLLHQYRSQGLTPPFQNADGSPTVSLDLLQQIGWKVEHLGGGQRTLTRPLADPGPRVRRRREDYDHNT